MKRLAKPFNFGASHGRGDSSYRAKPSAAVTLRTQTMKMNTKFTGKDGTVGSGTRDKKFEDYQN
jgi:hypothetical protein